MKMPSDFSPASPYRGPRAEAKPTPRCGMGHRAGSGALWCAPVMQIVCKLSHLLEAPLLGEMVPLIRNGLLFFLPIGILRKWDGSNAPHPRPALESSHGVKA